jgi:hypothetical protein
MCLLAVGWWPSTPEVCERERCHLDGTSQAASMSRRIGVSDAQLRQLYVTPVMGFDGILRRHRIVETEAAEPAARIADLAPTRSSRGPPRR